MNQEYIYQIQMLEQESNQLNQQLGIIEQNAEELQELKLSLDEIENSESKEIMANLGKKIFIPVEIKEKKLLVGIGRGNFVKKSIKDTIKIIDEQLGKLNEGRMQIHLKLNEMQMEIEDLMGKIQEEMKVERE